ncbi:MAG: hypothetical protein AB1442_02630 [Nitrospirota bacterium]
MMKCTFILFFVLVQIPLLHAAEMLSLQTSGLVVVFERPLEKVSHEVAKVYTVVRRELGEGLRWNVDFRPTVVLVRDRGEFRRTVGSDLVVAFAVPGRNLIVLDTSRGYTKPFTLKTTLKHELCHLLLHRYIEPDNLPRWIDEGVCQWASGGLSELAAELEGGTLARAAVSGRLIGLEELERFPSDAPNLALAYEESKSFIEFVERKSGKDGVLSVLGYLREGYSVDESIRKAVGISMPDLESEWRANLKRRHTWVTYLSNNIYTILFAFATLVTIYGFIRFLKRKREYMDEEEGDENSRE